MTVIVSVDHITTEEPYGKRAYLKKKKSVCNTDHV